MKSGDRVRLVEVVYAAVKERILNFDFLPGDRFTETEIAESLNTSRTPVREALFRLEQESFVKGFYRNGWQVREFDFEAFDELYDLRIILECAAIDFICAADNTPEEIIQLRKTWDVSADNRETRGNQICSLDEAFHRDLIRAWGNSRAQRIHRSIESEIHLIRKLDFTIPNRIEATYTEHNKVLDAIESRDPETAKNLIRKHIQLSKSEIKNISFHRLYASRKRRKG